MLVVDANVALDAALGGPESERIFTYELVAPPLMSSETLSGLRRAVWRGDVRSEAASVAFERLIAAPIKRRAPRRLNREACAVATELGWAKTYDAEYVALARLLGCRLLTRLAGCNGRLHAWSTSWARRSCGTAGVS